MPHFWRGGRASYIGVSKASSPIHQSSSISNLPWPRISQPALRYDMPSLTSIAEQILANAKTLDEHLATRNSLSPSFDLDSLVNLSPELEPVRDELINSTHTLNKLAQGPVSATIGILYCVGPRTIISHDCLLKSFSGLIWSLSALSILTNCLKLCPSMAPLLTGRSHLLAVYLSLWCGVSCDMQ